MKNGIKSKRAVQDCFGTLIDVKIEVILKGDWLFVSVRSHENTLCSLPVNTALFPGKPHGNETRGIWWPIQCFSVRQQLSGDLNPELGMITLQIHVFIHFLVFFPLNFCSLERCMWPGISGLSSWCLIVKATEGRPRTLVCGSQLQNAYFFNYGILI